MLTFKKKMAISLTVLLTFSLAGCGQTADTASQQIKSQAAKQVVDANGTKVTVPGKADRIAITCQGGTTQEVAIIGGADKIVAQPSMDAFPQMQKMYPKFKSIVNPGSFDDVSVEEIIKANPDMVLVGITSKKGNKLIADAGFPTFTMLIGMAGIEPLKNEFLQMGTLLGNEAKAKELVKYWNDKLAYVNGLVSKVPANEKKSVLYGYATSNGLGAVHGSGVWGDSFIKAAGGINAVKIEQSKTVSPEQVMSWNPDVIVLQKSTNAVVNVKNDPKLSDLKAIKNNKIYQVPIGAFWWDRPSPEAPLGIMWLATEIYPEYTKDIDLKKETKEFFKEFYNYDLSDDEYNSFF